MSIYQDVTNTQTLNGVPLDQVALERSLENQKFLKEQSDANDDLSALARDIVPAQDNTLNIGSDAVQHQKIYGREVLADKISTAAGTPAALSSSIKGDATTGYYSPIAGELLFMANGYQSLSLSSARIKAVASNNSQVHIESTELGKEKIWALGGNSDGIVFSDPVAGYDPKLLITTDEISSYYRHNFADGSDVSPGISFGAQKNNGFYFDTLTSSLRATLNGLDMLEFKGQKPRLMADQFIFKNGAELLPSIAFEGNERTGFSFDTEIVRLNLNGSRLYSFSENELSFKSDIEASLNLDTYSVGDTSGEVRLSKARGTREVPTEALAGDELGSIVYNGLADAATVAYSGRAAKIAALALENFSLTGNGCFLTFDTTKPGAAESFPRMQVGNTAQPTVQVKGSLGLDKRIVSTGTHVELDVEDISVLKLDTTAGPITLDTLANGYDTQMLFVFKSDPANTVTIVNSSASLGQKIFTQNQVNLVLGAGFGGATFYCDEGQWKEISIS